MRPEPLETTLQRLSTLGYTSIELEGEPSLYPVDSTRRLLAKYNIKCWGTVTIMQGTRDLTAADPQQRRDTIRYIKDVSSLSSALGGEIVTIVPRPRRQIGSNSLSGRGVGMGHRSTT